MEPKSKPLPHEIQQRSVARGIFRYDCCIGFLIAKIEYRLDWKRRFWHSFIMWKQSWLCLFLALTPLVNAQDDEELKEAEAEYKERIDKEDFDK